MYMSTSHYSSGYTKAKRKLGFTFGEKKVYIFNLLIISTNEYLFSVFKS